MLKALGHSGFDRFLVQLGLPDPDVGKGSGLMARTTSLAKYAIEHPDAVTAEGRPLAATIVAEAGDIYRQESLVNITEKEREAFQQASANDGAMSDVTNPLWDSVPHGTPHATPPASTIPVPVPATPNHRVFIVHGHDEAMKLAVSDFVRAIGLDPVILADQPNGGRTVIEKFEKNADVGYAIILLSPDDYNPGGRQSRARQNVVLEWGYFIGRLGRSHVCALKRGDVELPSDIIGMVWESFDDHGGWKRRLIKEIIEAGIAIDARKASMA
nr:nucleotide-binding protein [Luteimonas sp. XNQY3]